MIDNNIAAIVEVLKGSEVEDTCLMILFNEYCDRNNHDNYIHYMSEFPKMTEGSEILDIIRSLDKEFDADDDYFYIDSYGDYCSGDDIEGIIDTADDMECLAKSIAENWYDYYKALPMPYQNDISTEVHKLFLEWAKKQDKAPMEWLEWNSDGENAIVMDWDEYLNELAEDYKSETEDED